MAVHHFRNLFVAHKKWFLGILLAASTTHLVGQDNSSQGNAPQGGAPIAQVVAVDECDPVTLSRALGPDFCKNVTLGAFTTLSKLLAQAEAGHPDPKWNFEPDTVRIKEKTILNVVDEGGEPHTVTEVAHFGGGFISGLNAPGEDTVAECVGGPANIAVARTRILQGSSVKIADLPKGEHLFQCCIHPRTRVKVEVK